MVYLKSYFKSLFSHQRFLIYGFLLFVVIFNAIFLYPELKELSPDLNDDVFHYSLAVSMLDEIQHGGNPIDHWVPYWSLGFPVFHHYQHLPHLVVVLAYYLLFQTVSLFFIFHLIFYLILVFYPLVLYFSLRKMRFSRLAAAGAALFSLSLSNINGYGFELGAFVWRGSGIYSQLWAMLLMPLALSSIYKTLEENQGYFQSVIFLFLLANSQIMFSLMGMITASLFIFTSFKPGEIWERLKRLLLIFVLFFVVVSYLLIPAIVDSPYHAHSPYDFPEKWNSYGWQYITTQFLNGNLLDFGRISILTVLAVTGLLFSLSKKAFNYRWAGAGFILWFLLYFGRPTWGALYNIFPMSSSLHLHRFVTMVHFFGAILAGVGLAVVYQSIKKRFDWKRL